MTFKKRAPRAIKAIRTFAAKSMVREAIFFVLTCYRLLQLVCCDLPVE